MPNYAQMGILLSFKMLIIVFFWEFPACSKKNILSQKKNSYHFSLFLFRKLSFQSFRKSKNAKSLSSRHTFVAILSKIFFFESFNFAKKSYQLDKGLWNWFSITSSRDQKSGYQINLFGQISESDCWRSHNCCYFFVAKTSLILSLGKWVFWLT